MNSRMQVGDERMSKKADKILNSTVKLFIREGVKKTTMDDIAANSSVSKVTVYKYFVDKDTLYFDLAKHIFSQHIVRLEKIIGSGESLVTRLYDYLDAVSDFVDSGELDLCRELAAYNSDIEAVHRRYLQTHRSSMLTLIDEGIAKGLIKNELSRDMIFHYIDMGITYYQQSPEYRNKMLNDTEFRQQFMLFYISSIFTDGAKMLSTSR